jgi:ubiquinone/menaquinone biosynthesis C-methylase UbiE
MKSKAWFYNEIQQVGVDYENVEEVKRYDARMHRLRDIKRETENLIQATSPTSDSTVLEIGCGTGEFAIALSGAAKEVIAADVSPVMLQYAKDKAETRGIKNIEFVHAGFLTYEGLDMQFDIIVSQLALHHLPDFWKAIALQNVRRMLKAEGVLYLKDVVYSSQIENYEEYFDTLIANVETHVGQEFTKEYNEHIRNEYSTLDWIMDAMLTREGFEIINTVVENEVITTYLCKKSLTRRCS